ncbi:unnamed protein product [Arctogadus glacialis]
MCAARFNGSINGFAEEASPGGGNSTSARAPVSRLVDWNEAWPRVLHALEVGTVMTVFYQKSQRPERRTFQIRQDTRQMVWSRNPDKVEGETFLPRILFVAFSFLYPFS